MTETRYLRTERLKAGVSIAAVAAEIGITESAVSYIETGRSIPRVGTLYASAKAIGLESLADALAPVVAELEHGGLHANATGRRPAAQS